MASQGSSRTFNKGDSSREGGIGKTLEGEARKERGRVETAVSKTLLVNKRTTKQ